MTEEGRSRRRRIRRGTGRSLNLILWFAFSAFAIVILMLYVLAQNLLVSRQYREQIVERLRGAGEEMRQTIAQEKTFSLQEIGKKLYSVAAKNNVNFVLIYESGESALPDYTDQESYPTLVEELRKLLSADDRYRIFSTEDSVSYAASVTIDGRACYLYVTGSLDPILQVEEGLWVLSLVAVLFAVVLSFVTSGFIAMLITKPVTEVTERAKDLARGNFDLNFKEDYYCTEINDLSEALDHARAEISKADRMQKELIANVSHDFKTPLTMIKAYASMIREISGENPEKRDAHAKIIIDEADRLTALVEDVLDLSKIRAGVEAEARTVFNLSEEVYRVAGRFDYLRETKGYRIETEIEDDCYTCACRERIEQVLYNLIGNAVNYTGADKRIRVRLFRQGGGTRFEVIDSGKGIPEEEVETIWDRYYRSAEMHKRPVKGTGLGLSIVKGILLAHDCPFGVISEVGKGSCFWVEFSAPPGGESTGQEKRQGNAAPRKKN